MDKKTRLLWISCQDNVNTIGLKYLHAFALSRGYESSILFLPTVHGLKENALKSALGKIGEFVELSRPDMIGVSLMTPEYAVAVEITTHLKRVTDTPIVWGGIHPTVEPYQCLEHADAVCIGEAEWVLDDLVSFVLARASKIPSSSIYYKDADGRVVETPVQKYDQPLDLLPFPEHIPSHSYMLDEHNRVVELDRSAYSRFDRYKGRILSITTSRGCPFDCSYCCNNAFKKLFGLKSYRGRSVENVIRELERIIGDNPDSVMLIIEDDCFIAHSLDWIKKFSDYYKDNVSVPFLISANPKLLTTQKLELLRDTGCLSFVRIGIQSGSERINRDIYHRHTSREDVMAATRLLKDFKVGYYVDMILDNPYEKRSDQLESIRLLSLLPRPFHAQLYSLTMYPGTDINKMVVEDSAPYENPVTKHYLDYSDTLLNRITRMAGILPKRLTMKLADMEESGHPLSRMAIRLISFACLPLEMVNLFRVLWIGCGGNTRYFANMFSISYATSLKKYFRFIHR